MRSNEDLVATLIIAGQRDREHPLCLARKFDDWTERTGILDGSGLTWVGRLPIGLVCLLVSYIYWLITHKNKTETKEATE